MTVEQFTRGTTCPMLWRKSSRDLSASDVHTMVNDVVARAEQLRQYPGYEKTIVRFATALAEMFTMALVSDDIFKLAAITKQGSRVLKDLQQ